MGSVRHDATYRQSALAKQVLNRYDPLLKKCSIIQGHFDEDLYQSLILEFVRAVSAFKI